MSHEQKKPVFPAELYIKILDDVATANWPNPLSYYDEALATLFRIYIEDVRYPIEHGDVGYFHKGFRQVDIIDARGVDITIYTLLNGSRYAIWLLEFMRGWSKERPLTKHDVFAAMLDKFGEPQK